MTDTTTKPEVCLLCGETIQPNPISGWDKGNDPWPLTTLIRDDGPARRCCDECNGLYVIPARLGHPVEGNLYSRQGILLGEFGTEEGS